MLQAVSRALQAVSPPPRGPPRREQTERRPGREGREAPACSRWSASGQVTALSVRGDRDLGAALPPTFLAGLQFLEELDLSHNRLGSAFPEVGEAVARLVLADNNFTGKIPARVSALGQLQYLDVSGNRLQGWIPSSIFALPALRYINLSRNRLAGELPATTACAEALAFVDVSANLLTGARPACMRGNSSARTVLVAGNCFADAKQQRPSTYCSPGALAAVLPPPPQGNGGGGHGRGKGGEIGMILAIAGSVAGGALLIALVMVVVLRRARRQHPEVSVLPKSPAATPARKADGWKAPAKATQKIITPADKSKRRNSFP